MRKRGYIANVGAWMVGFNAVILALGEPKSTVAEFKPNRIRYGWDCGCVATTTDGVRCLIVACEKHEQLLPPETAVRG